MKGVQTSGWVVDAVGALLVGGALLLSAWFGIVQTAEARTALRDTRKQIATSGQMLAALDVQREKQRRLLQEHERVLKELGGGSQPWTAEEYLQTVASLAKKYDVRVVQHKQLGERQYPGLGEQLYSFHVQGSTKNLWLLLRAIEEIHAWADVSYLKLESGGGKANRMAAITVSMFFEQDQNAPSQNAAGKP